MRDDERRRLARLEIASDPMSAHMSLFPHRHDIESPLAHHEVQMFFHSRLERVIFMAFRDFAKSTIVEEGVIIQAALGNVKNVIILGESEDRASDRLRAIKHEIEFNEKLRAVFGDLVGPTWGERKIVLANATCIQAFGRGQSLRGVKHLQWRPDLCILDDVEDEEAVSTSQARLKVLRWWTSTVRPAIAKHGRVRMLATPMADGPEPDDQCLPLRLGRTEQWKIAKYPIKYRDADTGEWVATWPRKFTVKEIDRIEEEMRAVGRHADFMREYMCEATSDEARAFPSTIVPAAAPLRSPGWRPVFAAVDPARTARASSDFTGYAVWSWEAHKLVVWESGAKRLEPDGIIDLCFDLHKRYGLAALGVEEDGLNDFLMQPLRLACKSRGTLPFLPLKAPKGKRDFIRELIPFFKAGEVELNGDTHGALRDQLLAFPSGKDDAPNALAYALKMRGEPRYPMFGPRSVVDDPRLVDFEYWIAVAAKEEWIAGALVAVKAPRVIVLRDAIAEGDPRELLPRLAHQLGMHCDSYTLVAGPVYHERYDTTGLRYAASRIPARLHRSGDILKGHETIARLLRSDSDGPTQFVVSERARWSLRAFAGGVGAQKTLFAPLSLLTDAIESLMAMYQGTSDVDGDRSRRYDYTPQGRRYLTSAPDAGGRDG